MVYFRRSALLILLSIFFVGPSGVGAKDCANCGGPKAGGAPVDLMKHVTEMGGSCSEAETKKQFETYSAASFNKNKILKSPSVFSFDSFTTVGAEKILDEKGKVIGYKPSSEYEKYYVKGNELDEEVITGNVDPTNFFLGKDKETSSSRTKTLSQDIFDVDRVSKGCGMAFGKRSATNADCVLGVLYGAPAFEDSVLRVPPDKTVMPDLVRANYVKNGIFLSTAENTAHLTMQDSDAKYSSLKMYWKPEEARDMLIMGEVFAPLRKKTAKENVLNGMDPIRILSGSEESKRCGRQSFGDLISGLLGQETLPYQYALRFKKTADGPLVSSFDRDHCSFNVKEQGEERKSIVPELIHSLSVAYEVKFKDVLRDNKDPLYQKLRAFTLANWKPKQATVGDKPNLLLESTPSEWKAKSPSQFISKKGAANPAADFAETVAMYQSEPEKLRILSPSRYSAMKGLFDGVEFIGAYPKWPVLEAALSAELLASCKPDFEKIRCTGGGKGVVALEYGEPTSFSCFQTVASALDKAAAKQPDYCARSGETTVKEWLAKKLLAEANSQLTPEQRDSCKPAVPGGN